MSASKSRYGGGFPSNTATAPTCMWVVRSSSSRKRASRVLSRSNHFSMGGSLSCRSRKDDGTVGDKVAPGRTFRHLERFDGRPEADDSDPEAHRRPCHEPSP